MDAALQEIRAWWASDRFFTSTALVLVVVVQTVRVLNGYLSQRALNNGVANSHWDWSKEVVLVTGGSSGVGEATVARFARRGVKTLILDVNPPSASASSNNNVHFYKVDITNATALNTAAAKIRNKHGSPSVLINNAAISTPGLILEKPMASIRRLIDINLLAQFQTIKEFVPDMAARNHGHIVSVASLAAFMPGPGVVDYAAAKAGLFALHEGLSMELAYYHNAERVRTSIAFPGWMSTPMSHNLEATGKLPEQPISPDKLAAEIEKAVLSGNSQQIFVPKHLWILVYLQGFSHWLQQLAKKSASKSLQPAMNQAIGRTR